MLQSYKSILVPIDGSYESELAFKKAINVAKRNGEDTSLHLVHVVDTRAFQNISSFDTTMVEQVTETAKKTLSGYADEAKKAGVKNVDFSVEYGAPKVIIAKDIPDEKNIQTLKRGFVSRDSQSDGNGVIPHFLSLSRCLIFNPRQEDYLNALGRCCLEGEAIVAKPWRMSPFDARVASRGACAWSVFISGIDFFMRKEFAWGAAERKEDGARERV